MTGRSTATKSLSSYLRCLCDRHINVKTTLQIKLLPNESQHAELKDTMRVFNDACNYIAEVAYRD